MANAKEGPRQKLIGMMYLVLTALLALQVSSALIEKFQYMDDSIHLQSERLSQENARRVLLIGQAVKTNGNKPNEVKAFEIAGKVREQSAAALSYITALREELIEKCGGREASGLYKGAKEETKVALLMVGPEGQKSGKAYELQRLLNASAASIAQLSGNANLARPLALDGKEDPLFEHNPEQKRKDFAHLNFAQTPLVAALAVISIKEAELLQLESRAIAMMEDRIDGDVIKVNKTIATYRLKSEYVTAGTPLEGEVFMAATSTTLQPRMNLNGSALPVDPNGVGQVKMLVGGGNFDQYGFSKRTMKAEVWFKNNGRDSMMSVDIPFTVVKPMLKVGLSVKPLLYSNCGNYLTVDCPSLGAAFQPQFTGSTGGVISAGRRQGEILVKPNATSVKLVVKSQGQLIGEESYRVEAAPKAMIEVWNRSRPLDTKAGGPMPSSITLKALCINDEFTRNFPQDARYSVAEAEIKLIGPNGVKGPKLTVRSSYVDLSSLEGLARRGDVLQVTVIKVIRKNYLNELVPASFISSVTNYTII
jgi:gliding motility-associated protein GldM